LKSDRSVAGHCAEDYERYLALAREGTLRGDQIEAENDKNPVIALREIAERTIQPSDVREGLIRSIQHDAEVDEPESMAVPTLPRTRRPLLVRDDQSIDTVVDVMTEEELPSGMEKLAPMELSTSGGGGISGQGA
jgi:DNA-directed RNA polymerase subunit omega